MVQHLVRSGDVAKPVPHLMTETFSTVDAIRAVQCLYITPFMRLVDKALE